MINEKGETLFFQVIRRSEVLTEFEPDPSTQIKDIRTAEELLDKMSGGGFEVKPIWKKAGTVPPKTKNLAEFTRHFREWYAEHFEDFDSETNAELLCLDNEAAHGLGE